MQIDSRSSIACIQRLVLVNSLSQTRTLTNAAPQNPVHIFCVTRFVTLMLWKMLHKVWNYQNHVSSKPRQDCDECSGPQNLVHMFCSTSSALQRIWNHQKHTFSVIMSRIPLLPSECSWLENITRPRTIILPQELERNYQAKKEKLLTCYCCIQRA